MATPFTAWKHTHFTVEQVGRSAKPPQHTARAPCIALPQSINGAHPPAGVHKLVLADHLLGSPTICMVDTQPPVVGGRLLRHR